jgi:cytochrome c biogenesis protein CcmG, thiol:disulfide interchange protein DsbE
MTLQARPRAASFIPGRFFYLWLLFYHSYVITRTIFRSAALVVCLALAAGCNRGSYPSQVGERAPNFTIHDGTQTVSLSQYRGKVVVLNFWSSWCVYCAAEWPSLEQLQNKFPNLVVLAVAFDSDPAEYRQYVIDNQLHNMTVILDPTDKSNLAFGTTRPPETYIIDRKGIIRRKFIGAQDWNTPEIQDYLRSL